ncbi:efflux transporter outer membrane subunit [Cupriavidus necator]|uniref:efflux transporter outer membrane subunit n=1 Tax=Cupriavidus necator TaxID=106590 RepID=UPI00148FB7A0|nr:efflux transporter outer membrane subunit [Cupriavidus necator]NOV22425.1 efflux transporter outer membrane subunit [Cupriavidus necator]
MRRSRVWLACAVAACLCACTTVGPDYRVPENALVRAPAAKGSLQGAHAPGVAIAPVPDDWWRLYEDERLDRLVVRALAANTDIRAAAANLRRALALLHEVEAENLPQGSASASVSRAQLSGESFLQQVQPPVFNLGDFGLGVSYLIDFFGQLARADEAALAGAQASAATLDMVRVTVAAQTVRAYVQGCAATHDLHAATQQLAVQQRTLDTTRRLLATGRAEPAEVAREQARTEALRATLPPLQAARSAARYRLALLLGQAPAALPDADVACEAEPTLRAPLPVGDGAALLRRRPDVRQAERELAVATARIGVATADLYPSIRIGASAGLSGVLSHLGSGPTARWSIGPLVSWTWPTNGVRHRIHAQEAAADAALARFDGVVLRALYETETALSAYTRELERQAALHAASDGAAQAARQQRRLWQAGRLPYLAHLDAERDLAAAQTALAASAGQVAAQQVNLFLALGGGWQTARNLTTVPESINEKND